MTIARSAASSFDAAATRPWRCRHVQATRRCGLLPRRSAGSLDPVRIKRRPAQRRVDQACHPSSMLFNTREQNQLYTAIVEAGFEPSDFGRGHSETVWEINYRPTGDLFRLNESPEGLWASWKVADGRAQSRVARAFSTALQVLRFWLAEAKAEMEAPDRPARSRAEHSSACVRPRLRSAPRTARR
jgi:hypothetical protein